MTPESIAGRIVAVTGGAGFIGRHLVRRLAELGAARVVVLDRQAVGPVAASADTPVDGHTVVLGETPASVLLPLLEGADFLFHLAAEKHSAAHARPNDILRANVLGTHTLFDVACEAGVRKVVFASSLYAYGRKDGDALTETETATPDTVYGISKLAGEHLGVRMALHGGPKFVALRYFFAYGPEQAPLHGRPSLMVRTFERLARREPPTIRGEGSQSLDYVYVDDVVDQTIRAMEVAPSSEIINVGSGEALAVTDLVALMQGVAGTSFAPLFEPADDTQGSRRVASITKMERLLGPTRVTLEQGLERTWNWVTKSASTAR